VRRPTHRFLPSAWYTVPAGWSCRIKRSLAVRQRIYGCRHELGAREPAAPPGKHAEGPCGLRHAHAHDFGVPAGPLELCSAAAQQARTDSRNRRMPARVLADGRPRAQVQFQITTRELQRRGAHGEHLDARDCAQWPTVEAQVCRSHSPLTRSAHSRTAHPLTRSPAPRRVHGDFCAKCGMIGCTSSSCATTSVEIMSIPRIPHLCSDVDWECGVSGEQQLRY
jgi:hypothetical protein